MSKNILEYKGYYTKINYSVEDRILFGKIEGINDLVNFESESSFDIEEEFHKAVDDYLALCKDLNIEPDKVYSGTFNVRITPDLHKKIAIEAYKNDKSLNQIVHEAITSYFIKDKIHIENINLSIKTKERQQSILNKNVEMWGNMNSSNFSQNNLSYKVN